MKVILIDDEANNGWREIVEKVLFNNAPIEVALNAEEAKEKLNQSSYDLILLDLRFGEVDHANTRVEYFGGYTILKQYVRNSFDSLNFSTPVILFTASNKAWNIFEMLENGVDEFYIKEHPDTAMDLDFSRQNYKRLKTAVPELIAIGIRRKEVWNKILSIINYTKMNIDNSNIKIRIEEKLKIGYGLLFRNPTKVENELLLFNNEINAFIVFWSILEEIAKDSFKDNWIMAGSDEGKMHDNKWILRNGRRFVEDLRVINYGEISGVVKVGLQWDKVKGRYLAQDTELSPSDRNVPFYTGKLGLALQMYAVLLLGKNWPAEKAAGLLKPLNEYRNEIDFIHSSVTAIFTKQLAASQNDQNAYGKCIEVLNFIEEVVSTN